MDLNEFINKYGSNTQSNESWIFPDKPQLFKNDFNFIGLSEKKSVKGEDIPVIELIDVESKVKMLLSFWSTDKQMFNDGIEVGDKVRLSLSENKIHIAKAQ